MSPKVYIGGKLYDKSEAKVSVFDHGLDAPGQGASVRVIGRRTMEKPRRADAGPSPTQRTGITFGRQER